MKQHNMKSFEQWKRDNSAEMDSGSIIATGMLVVIVIVSFLAA